MSKQLWGASLIVLFTACGRLENEGSAAVARGTQALAQGNGSNLNGSNLNGSNLNGSNLNGSNLNGQALVETLVAVDLAGAKLNGSQTLERVWLDGTQFRGVNGNGAHVSGTDFLQSEFVGRKGDGTTVRLRIAALTPPTSDDVWRYDVSYLGTDSKWWPVCKDSAGATWAVPVTGRWNYQHGVPGGGAKTDDGTQFTFACPNSAITKCVSMGYKPWLSVGGESLDRHHQACVRLIRADYCSDGTSYTHDGNWVNVIDGVGIQADTEDWYFEAEWDQDGARCFTTRNRYPENVPCYKSRVTSACGKSGFGPGGAVLMSETPQDK